MLNLRADVLILYQFSVITINCFISSLGCGYSYILIIFKMQWGNVLDSLCPAFISFIESPTTIRFVTYSVLSSSISCSFRNSLIFHCVGGNIYLPSFGSMRAEMMRTRSFNSDHVWGITVCELYSTQLLCAFVTISTTECPLPTPAAFLRRLATMLSIYSNSSWLSAAIYIISSEVFGENAAVGKSVSSQSKMVKLRDFWVPLTAEG